MFRRLIVFSAPFVIGLMAAVPSAGAGTRVLRAAELGIPGTSNGVTLIPPKGGAPSPNWAGNIINGKHYTNAKACWVVPGATGGSHALSSHWVGVGLGNQAAHPLVQAGSESPGSGNPYLWLQVYPQNQVETALDGTADVNGKVHHFGSVFHHHVCVQITFHDDGKMWFTVNDKDEGQTAKYYRSYPGATPDWHAEYIVEKPDNSNFTPTLAHFETVTFTGAQAYEYGRGWKTVGLFPHYYFWISDDMSLSVNDPGILAFPGPIDTKTGGSYNVTWRRAS